jgi:ElaB/YqjD/DUF883 family membrane-anchored ribosome-binding protein
MSDKKKQEINFHGENRANNQVFGDQTNYGNLVFGGMPGASDDVRAELQRLTEELNAALKQVPDAQKDDAATVEALAQEALDEASREEPRRKMLEIKGENLKKAAQNLLAVSPIAVAIARKLLMIG